MEYQSFNNSVLSIEANSVRLFLQDEQGLMWIGTNRGLYSYDGYESIPHFIPGSPEDRTINCGLFFEDDFLLLGTDAGFLKYNYRYDKYEPFEIEFLKDIRSMVITEEDLWLGCADGLYRYSFDQKTVFPMFDDISTGIVHSLLEDRGFLYVELNGCLGRISTANYGYEQIEDPTSSNCGRMVNSFMKDESRDCIWIGEGSKLTKYSPATNSLESFSGFPVVKSIGLDCDANLVIGTDNGLYIYNEKENKHLVHNAQKPNSLANNTIWTVFRDNSENIWLGTDYGISMAPRHIGFEFIPIFQFSGMGDGNQFHSVFKDSKGFYWLGGDNGLIRTRNYTKVDKNVLWYNMGKRESYISHSHIRDVFEDSEHNLWVATDYGIGRYDYATDKFKTHFIRNDDGSFNANWSYDILEDDSGNLWISSFNGGIFKINKNRLLRNQNPIIANSHYSTLSGLSSNNIDQIIFEKNGNIWTLHRNTGIDILDSSTGTVTKFPIMNHTNGHNPNYMIDDSIGNIWVGFRNGVVRIDPVRDIVKTIHFEDADNAMVLSLAQVENSIWASSTEGLWIIDRNDFSIHHINITNKVFYDIYFDRHAKEILLGGPDEIAKCSPSVYKKQHEVENLIISSITVNNDKYINSSDEPSIRYSNKLELPYHQNNLVIKFSDLQYSKENRAGKYIFKLEDDDNWTALKANENTIHINRLLPGSYSLTIAQKESKSAPIKTFNPFQIVIHPPWYSTNTAKFIYALLLTGLIIWSITFFIQKQKLKFARIEKKKTLEQSKLKIDFFTNIAHEFKTPLSLIIAPLSGLINQTRSSNEKDALTMIHQNALKLNSLIHQAIDYYRDNSNIPMGLVLSRVDLVEFGRSIFSTYEANMKEKQIDFIFNSNLDRLAVDIDVLKIESILNNLLSNACKYTDAGDTIILNLNYSSTYHTVEIKVSDTGIGIPEKDLPFIFQRFFQSYNNEGREGTGIGLYLVKSFAELHGGTVNVISNREEGTSFTITLPAIENNIVESAELQPSNNIESKEKSLIVIVEDNAAIANFVYHIFVPEFQCIIASNGKTGLKICVDLKPDIIISDIMMPVMDGLEMCKRLKSNIPTSTIPVILLTAKDDKETELKSINLQIDAFIAKPFDSNILYSRVKQLLENQKQLRKKMRIETIATPVEEKVESADEKFLAHITQIIEEQIDNPDLNVTFLCKKAGVPQKQLYRKVKSLTGLTAVEYIKSIRIKKAAILLSNKNFTVAEVMYKVGFSNHSYFAKCFNAEFGKTPHQFAE
jgi:signal transduction histidine kinase/DNA-binding response OmpR family regulator